MRTPGAAAPRRTAPRTAMPGDGGDRFGLGARELTTAYDNTAETATATPQTTAATGTGTTGASGERGPQGEKGDKGDAGETGPAGADGADGSGLPTGTDTQTVRFNGTTAEATSAFTNDGTNVRAPSGTMQAAGYLASDGRPGKSGFARLHDSTTGAAVWGEWENGLLVGFTVGGVSTDLYATASDSATVGP